MTEIRPSAEQQRIVDLAVAGDSVAITAGAGTGKTTTLRMASDAKPDQRGLYVTFSKPTQLEAAAVFPDNVDCRTAHSLAWQAGGKRYKQRMDQPRIATRDIADHIGATDLTVWWEDERNGSKTFGANFIAGLAMKTVDRFCQSADADFEPRHVPRIEGLDERGDWRHHDQIRPDIVKLARKAWWDDLIKFQGSLRFTPDMYLKLWQLSPGSDDLGFDFVFADEAQDLSPVMVDVFQRQHKAGSQVIAVGDSQQQIYGWRGSVDGMFMIPDATPAELTESWRFGPEIAEPVNAMLDQLPTDLRIVGRGRPGFVGEFLDARVILARSNARIVKEAMAFVRSGVDFAIVGRLPKTIIWFAESAADLMAWKRTSHPELAWADSWGEVLDYVGRDMLGEDLVLMVRVIEEYGPAPVIQAMRAASGNEETAFRVLSTMHASKGREWPDVRLLDDYRRNESGRPDLSQEERRLFYVAASRAKVGLDIEACVEVFYPRPVKVML